MCKSKKFMAIALVATMVFGSCITAYAEAPVTSGGSDGAGASEGHVEEKKVTVILPTVPEGSTPFNYTMDPERLIQKTDAAKYAEGTTFPDSEGDKGVYFHTGEKTYANTSNTLQVINKSSCAIKLTVSVKATQNTAKDIELATSSTVATQDAPNLYLGLKVGSDTKVVKKAEQADTVEKIIAGVPDNFETAVVTNEGNEKVYTYREKANATTWKAMNISMEGAVSNLPIAADVTAPTVNVTWAYVEAESGATPASDAVDYSTTPAGPTEASASASSVKVGGSVNITLPAGVTISEIQKKKTDGSYNTLPAEYYTLEDITDGKKLTIKSNMLTTYTSATTIKVILSDGDPISINVTAN
jgi:hypothetical protein